MDAPHSAGDAGPALEVLEGTKHPSPEWLQNGGPPGASSETALFNPCGLAFSATTGLVYVADTGHHRVCVLKDGVLSALAGSGARGCADGIGTEAMFAHPCGLTISPEGTIFVRQRLPHTGPVQPASQRLAATASAHSAVASTRMF